MYLVMPLAAAGSLTKRAALYKDQIDPTITVAKALAAALAHAHKNGVIHRDHKPDNILFAAEDHHPLPADFGICLIEGGPRFTGDAEIVGPRSFMAPELAWSAHACRDWKASMRLGSSGVKSSFSIPP